MAEDTDRMKLGLGIPTQKSYQCSCGAFSSQPSCPDKDCKGSVAEIVPQSQF